MNRFEKLVQQVYPDMALHYWDWTQDPRAADDGQGGVVNLCTDGTVGTANGMVAGTLGPLHNGGNAAGARPSFGGTFTLPPREIKRDCNPGAPPVASHDDIIIITSADGLPQAQQWTQFRTSVESSHDRACIASEPRSSSPMYPNPEGTDAWIEWSHGHCRQAAHTRCRPLR